QVAYRMEYGNRWLRARSSRASPACCRHQQASAAQRGGDVLAVLTEEHQLVADTAVRLGESYGVKHPADLAAVDRAKAWSALAETGFLGLRIREDGSPVASGVEVALVAEALGR